nr:MAG TPA: hypothetical protein [Caudoviricetes sp.]
MMGKRQLKRGNFESFLTEGGHRKDMKMHVKCTHRVFKS